MTEINFGSYAVIDEVAHPLEKEPSWTWTVKPITTKEELAISRFLQSGPITASSDGLTRTDVRTNIEIAMEEIALTFGGTTIPGPDKKTPVLAADASLDDIRALLKTMPIPLLDEIWAFVGVSNLKWGPAKKKEPDVKN